MGFEGEWSHYDLAVGYRCDQTRYSFRMGDLAGEREGHEKRDLLNVKPGVWFDDSNRRGYHLCLDRRTGLLQGRRHSLNSQPSSGLLLVFCISAVVEIPTATMLAFT